MTKKATQTLSVLSLPIVLTLYFLLLQVAGVIDWPWYWLLSPMLTWFVIITIGFFTLIALAIKDGGGVHRAVALDQGDDA